MPRPRLSELTDYDPMGNFVGAQPTADPIGTPSSTPISNNVDKILNSIFRDDEKRLQLWPERLVREGVTAAGDVASGKVPTLAVDPVTGDVHTSPQMVEKAQAIAALAGTGGLASPGGSLNATPSLRPALKHNGKLYKGKPGQEHQDIIPDALYKDFTKKAMSGEDLAEYNFGFMNDKGHFLNREDALKYGIDNGIIDPQSGKFGALTTTLLADSGKPGVAIEAMKPGKLISKDEMLKLGADGYLDKAYKKLIPIEKIDGLEPTPAASEGIPYVKGRKITQPIEVVYDKLNDNYILYAGNHRITQANLNGDKYIPAFVQPDKGSIGKHAIDKLPDPVVKSDTPTLPNGYTLTPIDFNPFELKT